MKTFSDFVINEKVDKSSEKADYSARNAAIDIVNLVTNHITNWATNHPDQTFSVEERQKIIDYLSSRAAFSLKFMDENLTPEGKYIFISFYKNLIELVKNKITEAGYGKTGTKDTTLSRAERVDNFLKQKHIGPIKR